LTFTTLPTALNRDEDEADHSVADSGETDMVLTTSSDADSSGGSKVVATSVDGEDELVDVTMNDSNDVRESTETDPTSTNPPQEESSRYDLVLVKLHCTLTAHLVQFPHVSTLGDPLSCPKDHSLHQNCKTYLPWATLLAQRK
jgi:hypothetical protein